MTPGKTKEFLKLPSFLDHNGTLLMVVNFFRVQKLKIDKKILNVELNTNLYISVKKRFKVIGIF